MNGQWGVNEVKKEIVGMENVNGTRKSIKKEVELPCIN